MIITLIFAYILQYIQQTYIYIALNLRFQLIINENKTSTCITSGIERKRNIPKN